MHPPSNYIVVIEQTSWVEVDNITLYISKNELTVLIDRKYFIQNYLKHILQSSAFSILYHLKRVFFSLQYQWISSLNFTSLIRTGFQ